MRPRFLQALWITGAILGFSWGFASLQQHHDHPRRRFEEHVAAVCADAALRASRAHPTD